MAARKRQTPLVFISHDSRDVELAEAFANLLVKATGDRLRVFTSSDRRGTYGIAFGAQWYATVRSQLTEASDVVVLITPYSMERPWLLYEAGIAAGRSGVRSIGLALGVPLHEIAGPFAQLQIADDDDESITSLILMLAEHFSLASKRDTVREVVRRFLEDTATLRATPFRRTIRPPGPLTAAEGSHGPRDWPHAVFGDPLPGDWPDLFVLMPFDPGLRPVFDDHIKPTAARLALDARRADDFFSDNAIAREIWSAIYFAKVVLADCTGRNANVFYEIGLAHALGRRTLLIAQSIDDIPFDLRHLRVLLYEYTPRGMSAFEARLTKTLQQVLRTSET